MTSESDSDLIVSKRSKKRPILQDIDPSHTKSNNDDNAVLNVDGLFEHKKAVKRTRESEEESSITSDDEVNIKKRIRKNSDLYRPKKVVSAAARKRREVAKTLRESIISASETDSEYDSDENLKCEDTSRRKQRNSDSENEVLTDSKDHLKAEDIFSKKDIQKIQKPCNKAFQKNEDSSSAYNSDSQDGVRLQHIAKKEKKKMESSKSENISLSSNIISCNEKGEKSVNSESELDEVDNGTLDLENKLHKEIHIKEKPKKFSQDSQESNNFHSDIIEEKNKVSKNFKSENDSALHLSSNSEKSSLVDETVGKMKASSDVEDAEIKEKNFKQSLKEQNTLKSGSENCSDDDQPLNKSKKMTDNEENFKQNRIRNSNSDSSEDEKDGLLSKAQDQKMFKTNSSKKTLKFQNSSADSSDSDRPVKKTKTTEHLKQKKKKVVKQPSKKQYSSEEGSSGDEQPPKKTKSSGKFQRNSDSEESDKFTLKSMVKEVNKSKNKVHLSSSDEEKPLGKKKQSSSKKNPKKSEKVAKKPIEVHVPDGSSPSDDDTPLKKKKSSGQTKTKIAEKGKVLKSATNQNSSEEKNSEDEQPPKKTKSCGTKTLAASDSEDDIYQAKYKKMQNSKNRHRQSKSNSDDDKPPVKEKCVLNKKSNENNIKHEKKGIKQFSVEKKVSSDSEDEPIRFQEEKEITEIKIKNEKSETQASSEVSASESSSDSDAPLLKKTDSGVKVASEKTTVKKDQERTSKLSVKPEDAALSDSGNEKFKKKLMRKCTEDSSTQAKKEISDTETSEEETNSEDRQRKSSIKIKEMSDSDKQISDTPNKSLKGSNRTEISDSAESSDSGDDQEGMREGQSNSSKKSSDIVRKQSISTSCESDSDSSRKDKTKNKKKAPSKMVARINNLKKYIRAAGIHINNYASIWEGCKSDKQRADRLSKFLADHGMKGRPTLQKCKKLRVKLEKKREVEELDLTNIIDDENGGRYKCRSSRRQPSEKKDIVIEKEAAERAAELKQRFSRIKDLIESDSSSD